MNVFNLTKEEKQNKGEQDNLLGSHHRRAWQGLRGEARGRTDPKEEAPRCSHLAPHSSCMLRNYKANMLGPTNKCYVNSKGKDHISSAQIVPNFQNHPKTFKNSEFTFKKHIFLLLPFSPIFITSFSC